MNFEPQLAKIRTRIRERITRTVSKDSNKKFRTVSVFLGQDGFETLVWNICWNILYIHICMYIYICMDGSALES